MVVGCHADCICFVKCSEEIFLNIIVAMRVFTTLIKVQREYRLGRYMISNSNSKYKIQ